MSICDIDDVHVQLLSNDGLKLLELLDPGKKRSQQKNSILSLSEEGTKHLVSYMTVNLPVLQRNIEKSAHRTDFCDVSHF